MLLTSPRALSRNLPGYVASRINQLAVHKLAVWVEAGLSSLHFAELTRTKSLPHYWRTRVRRPRREPADPGNPAFFFPFRPPSPLSLYSPPRVGGCEHDDKAQCTCVTLSYPVPPSSSLSTSSSLLCTYPRPGTAHCSARSPAYSHTTYTTLFRGREFVARSSSACHDRSRYGRFLLALISRSPSYLET